MDILAIDQHGELNDFVNYLDERELWTPETAAGDRLNVAQQLWMPDDETEYEVITQRYHNNGGITKGGSVALKICVWQRQPEPSGYLGHIGYHRHDAPPYSMTPIATAEGEPLTFPRRAEGLLYAILRHIRDD